MAEKKLLLVLVRAGFVVSFEEKVKQGDKIVSREQQYFPEDREIQLDADRVLQHAHKLEPANEEARDFLSKLHVTFDAPAAAAAAPAVDVAKIASDAAASAVKSTLEALGIDASTVAAAKAAKAGGPAGGGNK